MHQHFIGVLLVALLGSCSSQLITSRVLTTQPDNNAEEARTQEEIVPAQRTTDVQEPVASPPTPTITTIAQSEQIDEYVRGVFQDRDGNLWFSTRSGACRYDGKSLTYLRVQEKMGWAIEEILQDEDGALWLAGDGVFKFNGKSFDRIH